MFPRRKLIKDRVCHTKPELFSFVIVFYIYIYTLFIYIYTLLYKKLPVCAIFLPENLNKCAIKLFLRQPPQMPKIKATSLYDLDYLDRGAKSMVGRYIGK